MLYRTDVFHRWEKRRGHHREMKRFDQFQNPAQSDDSSEGSLCNLHQLCSAVALFADETLCLWAQASSLPSAGAAL